MSAAHHGSPVTPSAVGLPRDRPRRHRLLRSPAGVSVRRQASLSMRRGGRWAECRAPARSRCPADPGDLRSRDGRARPRAEACRGRRHYAGAQRPASGASGFDRIVGVMSATGSYDTVPSNRRRGATMGPPACPLQSPPVPSRWRRREGLQGLSSSWGDWRGQKVFLIRKRSQVRVLDRPSAGIQKFAAFIQFF